MAAIQRNQSGNFINDNTNEVIKKLRIKNGSLEYIYDTSGDATNYGDMYLLCKYCGSIFKRNKQTVKPSKKTAIRCNSCDMAITQINNKKRKIEKNRQRQEIKAAKKIEMEIQEAERNKEKVCQNCGEVFISKRPNAMYCSKVCMIRRNHHRKENRKRKRIQENGKVDNSITLDLLVKKENNTCYICGGKCDRKDSVTTKEGHFIAGQNYPTVEHIKPICMGGTHTWDNIKLAHKRCNERKGSNKLTDKNGQVRMIL